LVSAFPFALVIAFLKMLLLFILLLWSSMWFKKHLWDRKCDILLCFVTYVSKKKSFPNSQMGNIILLCHLCELKKNHLRANKRACHLLSYFAWVKKTNCGLSNVQDLVYSSHAWVEKTICKLVNVQYHFFSFSFVSQKKPCVGSQMCNIILSSPMWI
jgi:hypothetical protein